ncbi:MAG: L,D-transpeptidase family protein [Gammaproteobacteria bacterium]|nr:L,D-transpeptidase family protein [Gammaproteobacteria bacterium]NND53859.1 L,D-transpeptidase family protein [Gammaproteobacteria bacterium]
MPTKITLAAPRASRTTLLYLHARLHSVAVLLVVAALLAAPAHGRLINDSAGNSAAELRQQLKSQLSADSTGSDDLNRQSVDSIVQSFYAERSFRPAWTTHAQQLELRQLPRLAELHGLTATEYQLPAVTREFADVAAVARLELQISRTVLTIATHLRYGKMEPAGKYTRLRVQYDDAARTEMLHSAAASESLLIYLNNLAPQDLLYRKLQHSLAGHRTMRDDGLESPRIKAGRTLEPGMRDTRVPQLRQRLGLEPVADDADLYDAPLAAAVARFQQRHRLQADGIVGPRTRRTLNISLSRRIAQLRVNLEWQRWARTPAGTDYLRVNIPHYTLQWVEDGRSQWSMRTQVGNKDRQTPVFRSVVNAISANPTWTIPPTIFREDILPLLQTDAAYLQQKGMYVVDRRGRPVDAGLIDWQTTTADEFPYRLRRGPGLGNALGSMKFMMPNPYLIYLHDTPAKHLFRQPTRATSSGCIRVEEPQQLAEFLVSMQKQRSQQRLVKAMSTNKTRYIGFDAPVPIIILYATIDLNDEGELIFADDIYHRDRQVLAVLNSTQAQQPDTLIASLGGRPGG